MVFGLFRRKKKEEPKANRSVEADDNDAYIADHIEEIYRYIKAGNISKIREIFPEADGFSRGSYNYIGLDWKPEDSNLKRFHSLLTQEFIGKSDFILDKNEKSSSMGSDLLFRVGKEPFSTLTDYIDLEKVYDEFGMSYRYVLAKIGKGGEKDFLIYANIPSTKFRDLFGVPTPGKGAEMLFLATNNGDVYTLVKTHKNSRKDRKISVYVGEENTLRKIDEKNSFSRNNFGEIPGIQLYLNTREGPGVLAVKIIKGKENITTFALRSKVEGIYREVDDVVKGFARALAEKEPLYYTVDLKDLNYIFVFHPLSGTGSGENFDGIKNMIKDVTFEGFIDMFEDYEPAFQAIKEVRDLEFSTITEGGLLILGSVEFLIVNKNPINNYEEDHIIPFEPSEPLFLMNLSASVTSRLSAFATITKEELGEDGTVNLGKRDKIRFSRLVAPSQKERTTYEIYAGYNPETRKLGGMVLMHKGEIGNKAVLEVYEYDTYKDELLQIRRYDIPIKKWYGGKKGGADIIVEAVNKVILDEKRKEGIEKATIFVPYIDRFGDGSEESVDTIVLYCDIKKKVFVPTYMMRFKPVFESQ